METSLCEHCPALAEFWTTLATGILPAGIVIGLALSSILPIRRRDPARVPLRPRASTRGEAAR